jgi:threonine aldolase
MPIDLRSDTVTTPSPAMLEFMKNARVGDDVYVEDPTVNELEEKMAKLFGRDAALYCPTGTMSNQIAIKLHTQPGDEVVCEKTAHVYQYEAGGIAFNSGCQVKTIEGVRGIIQPEQLRDIRNPDDVHKAPTTLVCLENTSNRGGGSCYSTPVLQSIRAIVNEQNLRLHLDGARLFNAIVATGQDPAMFGSLFETISVCLNKGLGCPIGSVLIGDQYDIKKARRIRKIFGGGMRQAGFMAACGLFALENNIPELKNDHVNAAKIAEAIRSNAMFTNILPVETNIVIFEPVRGIEPWQVVEYLKTQDVLINVISGRQLRIVTHLNITPAMAMNAAEFFAGISETALFANRTLAAGHDH